MYIKLMTYYEGEVGANFGDKFSENSRMEARSFPLNYALEPATIR